MKQIKSIVSALVLMVLVFSCQKTVITEEVAPLQQKPSFMMDNLTNAIWEGTCDQPYNITLMVRQQQASGVWLWIWGIQNLNTTATPALSRFSIKLPDCVKVLEAKYGYQNQLEVPIAVNIAADPSYANCSTGNPTGGQTVMSFPVNTSGMGTTYLILVVDKEYAIDEKGTAYFQNQAGCGSTCFPGLACPAPCTEGCSYSQGRYFASPHAWPTRTVTVGGYSYTEREGRAIWKSSNQGGKSDAKKGFHQVAAIKLSGNSVGACASVWADVKIVEDWLKTLPKLTPHNVRHYRNKAVGEAAGRIGDWIDDNHCRKDNDEEDEDDDDDDDKKKKDRKRG